jgi:hypothetical protein
LVGGKSANLPIYPTVGRVSISHHRPLRLVQTPSGDALADDEALTDTASHAELSSGLEDT